MHARNLILAALLGAVAVVAAVAWLTAAGARTRGWASWDVWG